MKNKRIVLLLCVLLFLFSFTARAAEPVLDTVPLIVTYQDTLDLTLPEKFMEVTGLVPGDVFRQKIKISSNCKAPVPLVFEYCKPKAPSKLIDVLEMKIYYEGELLYTGPCRMETPTLLGEFTNQTATMDFEFYFPHDAGNEYQKEKGTLQFAFSVKADGLADHTDNSQTGDISLHPLIVVTTLSAGLVLLLLPFNKRKRHKKVVTVR